MQEYTYQNRLFGTDVVLSLVIDDESLARRIANETFNALQDFELRFSRFIPTSELSALNTQRSLIVSEDFLLVLQKSYELYKETGGLFNPLLQVSRLGYSEDFAKLNLHPNIATEADYNTNFDAVEIDVATRRVTLVSNQKLDFGGILKGYLAEKMAKHIRSSYSACQGVLVNLGGDIFVSGHDENNKIFVLEVFNPITKQSCEVVVDEGALVTSGTYKRTWLTAQGIRNHILAEDGVSNSATAIVSASVRGPNGAVAEAYTKALILGGSSLPPGYHYLLIKESGEVITNIT